MGNVRQNVTRQQQKVFEQFTTGGYLKEDLEQHHMPVPMQEQEDAVEEVQERQTIQVQEEEWLDIRAAAPTHIFTKDDVSFPKQIPHGATSSKPDWRIAKKQKRLQEAQRERDGEIARQRAGAYHNELAALETEPSTFTEEDSLKIDQDLRPVLSEARKSQHKVDPAKQFMMEFSRDEGSFMTNCERKDITGAIRHKHEDSIFHHTDKTVKTDVENLASNIRADLALELNVQPYPETVEGLAAQFYNQMFVNVVSRQLKMKAKEVGADPTASAQKKEQARKEMDKMDVYSLSVKNVFTNYNLEIERRRKDIQAYRLAIAQIRFECKDSPYQRRMIAYAEKRIAEENEKMAKINRQKEDVIGDKTAKTRLIRRVSSELAELKRRRDAATDPAEIDRLDYQAYLLIMEVPKEMP